MEGSVALKRARGKKRATERRVVITGMGVVSPIGTGLEKFWNNLIEGKTGIAKITLFDASSYPCQIAAEVKDFEPEKYLSPKQIRYYSRGSQFTCAAFAMAKEDAHIEHFDPYRTDVIVGTALSAFDVIEEEILKRPTGIASYEGVADPFAMYKAIITAPSTAVALMAQAQGYVTTVSSTCTSGLNALGVGYRRIKTGEADTAICGGVDTPINRLILGSFCATNFLTTNNDPENAICPFDKRHTKSVLCEGAGMFILEEFEQAKARGARIYAEVTAFNQETENINELFLLERTGERWARAIRKTVGEKKIDHINAHAPSDVFIDRVESKAIGAMLGPEKMRPHVSSIKGSVGGNFTPAGVFQIASAALSLHTRKLPPIFNYKYEDPECQLKFVKRNKLLNGLSSVLVNSRGGGSFNASVVLERVRA